MSLWSRVEQTLEGFVEGVFRRGIRNGIQPVEVARQLQRAMQEHRHVSVSHTYVPNDFTVRLHPDDLRELQPILRTLIREFTSYLNETAAKEQLSFVGPPAVSFASANDVPPSTLEVDARFSEETLPTLEGENQEGGPTVTFPVSGGAGFTQRFTAERATEYSDGERTGDAPNSDKPVVTPRFSLVLLESGERRVFPLELDHPVIIGRGSTSDVLLPDGSVSRSHARIEEKGGHCIIVDLGSTNGTWVNGKSITSHPLRNDDRIQIGEYALRFEGDK